MELFKQKTGADLTLVSYRGASASMADVLAGHLPLCVANINSLMGQVSAGKLKPDRLDRRPALAGDARHADLRRGGLSRPRGHLVVAVGGARPARRPRSRRSCRAATETRAASEPDVIDSMRQGGFEPGTMPLAEVDAFIKAEHKRWGEVIRAAGIKPQ